MHAEVYQTILKHFQLIQILIIAWNRWKYAIWIQYLSEFIE